MPTHATLDGTGKVPTAQLPDGLPGIATWGTIIGTLSAQTDLDTALSGKSDTSHAHAGVYQPVATVLTNTTAAFTTAQETKLSGIATGAEVNVNADWTSGAGDSQILNKPTLGGAAALEVGTTAGTVAAGDHNHTGVYQPLATPLTNTTAAFTTAQETKLSGIATGATVNSSDATLLDRANHTGSQASTTISDFSTAADARIAAASINALSDVIITAPSTNQVIKYNGSNWVNDTDSTGGGSYTLVATLAGNQATGANVTPVTLTGLVWTYAANSIYFFRWIGKVQPTAATTGCGFQLDVSSAITEIAMHFNHQLANTGTISGGHSIADDASVGVSSGMPGTSTYPVVGNGMLRTGANTGTAQLRFRSETTAVTTAIAGMTLVVEKVA